uniref:Surfeit locus protein 2-like isoform X2 n=1 Tax=Crassostrea virginica TaxID=6565 RepID=A0A8B8DCH7_CRAVI|nr:surfeit locus protein 2-like isoform X2 [Crassostrea virginica]
MAAHKTPCGSLSKELKKLLKQYPNFEVMNDKPRVKCSLSGHEMPCQVEAIQNYVKGKKYQKLLAQNQFTCSYEKYKEHIVPSNKKGRQHQLFCLLTLRHINNNPDHIKRHVEGRRFKKALVRWEECQRTGTKFQPISGKRKNFDVEMEEESNEDEAGSDVDSLSDLYPDINPEENGEEEEEEEERASDFDLEEMEENQEESGPVKNHSQGTKRKQAEGKKKKKNVKKKKT